MQVNNDQTRQFEVRYFVCLWVCLFICEKCKLRCINNNTVVLHGVSLTVCHIFDFTFLYFFVCCVMLFCSFCHIVLYIIATHCFIITLTLYVCICHTQ